MQTTNEHPFLILCGGDTAEADDWEGAMTALTTMLRDRWDEWPELRDLFVPVSVSWRPGA